LFSKVQTDSKRKLCYIWGSPRARTTTSHRSPQFYVQRSSGF
jgi:hypothetical protein